MNDKDAVAAYLMAYADLDCFYVTVGRGIQGGLIGYVDRSGKAWVLMEDDEELADACLAFLRSMPAAVFDSQLDEEQFIDAAKQRICRRTVL